MITMQEAVALGCTSKSKSCPNFINNYLHDSTSSGGTVNDTTGSRNYGYWTMSAASSSSANAWYVRFSGYVGISSTSSTGIGARAVVVVNK